MHVLGHVLHILYEFIRIRDASQYHCIFIYLLFFFLRFVVKMYYKRNVIFVLLDSSLS